MRALSRRAVAAHLSALYYGPTMVLTVLSLLLTTPVLEREKLGALALMLW